MKVYFIGENLRCCIRDWFDNVEFVCTVSRGDWQATQMSVQQQRRQTNFTNKTNTVNRLKQNQMAKRLLKIFHTALQVFLSLSSNPDEVFNNKKAKWHASWKAHISKTKLIKILSNERKNVAKTVPVWSNKKTLKLHNKIWSEHLLHTGMLDKNDRRKTAAWGDVPGARCTFQVVCNIHKWYWTPYQTCSGWFDCFGSKVLQPLHPHVL